MLLGRLVLPAVDRENQRAHCSARCCGGSATEVVAVDVVSNHPFVLVGDVGGADGNLHPSSQACQYDDDAQLCARCYSCFVPACRFWAMLRPSSESSLASTLPPRAMASCAAGQRAWRSNWLLWVTVAALLSACTFTAPERLARVSYGGVCAVTEGPPLLPFPDHQMATSRVRDWLL